VLKICTVFIVTTVSAAAGAAAIAANAARAVEAHKDCLFICAPASRTVPGVIFVRAKRSRPDWHGAGRSNLFSSVERHDGVPFPASQQQVLRSAAAGLKPAKG
jgi:hypothetical protein